MSGWKKTGQKQVPFFPYVQDCLTFFIPLKTRKNPSTPTKTSMTESAHLHELSYMLLVCVLDLVEMSLSSSERITKEFVYLWLICINILLLSLRGAYAILFLINRICNNLSYLEIWWNWYMYAANHTRCVKSRAHMLKGLLKHVVSRECVKKLMNIQSSFILFENFIHARDRGLLFLFLQFLSYPPHHSLQTSCVLFVFYHNEFTQCYLYVHGYRAIYWDVRSLPGVTTL